MRREIEEEIRYEREVEIRELRQKLEVKDQMIEKMGHNEVEQQIKFKQIETLSFDYV